LYYKSQVERERGCLDDEAIVRFLSGRLDAAARSSIEHHVDACAPCALLILPSGSRPERRHPLDTHALAAGDLVAGRYRIERFVGGGGMGEVYAALDEQLGERVALKTVRATIADDARAIARLKSEVQLARRVTHPNVCRIYDLGTEASPGRGGNLAFLTMELLAGTTLAERIRRDGAFPAETAGKVMRHLVAGLAAAHRAGVIHKDFKSDNVILVTARGTGGGAESFERAVITDFGLAAPEQRAIPDKEGRPEFSGTPGYIAPERLRRAPATAASDVYSLGVVLLDMLAGRVPARPRARAAAPGSRLDLRGIALRCCDDRPEARPGVGELADMLAALERRRAPRRSWRVAPLIGAATLLAVLFGLSLRSRSAVSGRSAPVAAPATIAEANAVAPVASTFAVTLAAPPRARPASRTPAGRRRAQVPRAPVESPVGASPAPAASLSPTVSRVERAAREDEPIRSLDGSPPKRGAVTLGAEDDAPIDPFARSR
jgi:tRNA A-37 threonylcarbamoyl transferase component Bud32